MLKSKEQFNNEIEQRVAAYIDSHALLHHRSPVLIALSGGADSVALLAILQALGYDCRAAHCNYHLRGEESMRDMRHCRQLCARVGVDLYVRDFDVEEYRRQHPGESVEMACRELRYRWFGDILDREGAQAVAVGHHREDRTETFFLNLMRGAGIKGLTSMRPRSGNTVRPLLDLSRQEVEQYLANAGLDFIVDSSNASDQYRRNALRNTVIPALEESFGGASDAVLRSISHLESALALYADAVEEKKRRYWNDPRFIDIEQLKNEAEAATLLYEWLSPLNFSYTQVCDILGSEGSGASFVSTDGAVLAELSHGTLELCDAVREKASADEAHPVNLLHDVIKPVHILVSRHPVTDFVPERLGPSVAYIDAAAVGEGSRWELRHYRRGDRMVPFGSSKSKLVSDIFAQAHLSASQKRRAWILTCNDEIVWILGLRNSAVHAVGPSTRQYLRLQIQS